MHRFIAIDVQDKLGNIHLTTCSMRVALAFIELHAYQIIDQTMVPELDDDGEFTGETLIVITVQPY